MDRARSRLDGPEPTTVASGAAIDVDHWRRLQSRATRLAHVAADLDMDAEDVANDALEALVRNQADVRDPEAYLYRAVQNRVKELRRRSAKRRGRLARAGTPPDAATVDDHLIEVHGLLEELAPEDRGVLYLRFVEGWSYARIADATRSREATVRKRCSRALGRLRPLLDDERRDDRHGR